MDPITLAYYGIVCGALGAAAPMLGHPLIRFAIGIAVGVVAVYLLPAVHVLLG